MELQRHPRRHPGRGLSKAGKKGFLALSLPLFLSLITAASTAGNSGPAVSLPAHAEGFP